MTFISKILQDELIRFRQCVPFKRRYAGNIGVFRYVLKNSNQTTKPVTSCAAVDASILGKGVFGASYKVYQKIRDKLRNDFHEGCTIVTNAITGEDEYGNPTGYKIYTHEVKPIEGEDAKIIFEFYTARPLRNYDSEYLLTNFLQSEIWAKNLGPGTFHLLTELPPCESCSNVLCAFLETNQDSDLHIYYLITPGGFSANFDQLLKTGRAKFTNLDYS